MKQWLIVGVMPLVVAAGCKKKPAEDKAAGSASGAASASASASGATPAGSAGSAVQTAEGGAVAALPVVTDCPKSLAGTEAVARTIKKECGPIQVTADYTVEGSLTLEAGAILKFADNAELGVGYNKPAKIFVKGTDKEPVTMTSAGDSAPGIWHGLRLYEHAARSQIEGLVLENAGDSKGAIVVDAKDVSLKGSTIRNAKEIGLQIGRDASFAALSGNTFDKAGKIAITTRAPAVASIGPNKFDEGAFIQIEGGTVDENAKWANPGAPFVVIDEVSVEGKNGRCTLEIAAGTELRFKDTSFNVGYNRDGTLVVAGTPEQPVVFTAAEDKTPGAWHGLYVYEHGEARITGAAFSFAGGGTNDRGALYVNDGALSLAKSSFKDNKRGVNLKRKTKLKALEGTTFSASAEPALALEADLVGAIGAGNTFDKDAHIEIAGGRIEHSATWQPQTVAYDVASELQVEKATLTLAPGVELAFADEELTVGYNNDSTLKAIGTKDKPIKLRALRDDATWKGLRLYGHAVNSELAFVHVAQTSGDAGIIVERDAVAKLSDVACAKCANAAVTSKCGAKLTATNIKADAGTPKGELKPSCK